MEVYLWQTKMKANVCWTSMFRVNTTKNATGKRRLTSSNLAASLAFMRRTAQQTTNNKLGELTENNKAPFSSQERKQFKLLTVPFKTITLLFAKWQTCELACLNILRRVPFAHVRYMQFFLAWSVNQIVLFNGSFSEFEEITSCVYTKTIILFNLGEYWL